MTPLLGTRSGVATVVDGLLRALAAADCPPELVTWTMSGRNRSDGGVGATPLALPASIAVPIWTTFGRPRVDRRLNHPDVIHGTNYVVPPSRVPTVVSVYDLSFIHDAASTSRAVKRFDSSVRAAVSRGAVIHTTANAVGQELRDRYQAQVFVIAPGITPRVQRSAPTGVRYIAAVGTAVARKNFPALVEAFGYLAHDRPELELRIAGAEGPDTPQIERALDALPPDIRRRAVHLGRVDDGAVAHLVEGAAVLAHPSRYEGFGLPILEAMSAGVPVVAADAGAATEVAGEAAVLVAPDDVHSLAAGLAKVLDDEAVASHLSDIGHAHASTFSWDRSASEMLRLYTSLIAS